MRPFLILGAAVLLAGCGSSPAADTTAVSATAAKKTSSATTHAGAPRAPVVVRVTVVGHLPAPVQLPAVASRPDGALAIGGLDAGDASVSSIVHVGAAARRR